jgi:hypothetical protein
MADIFISYAREDEIRIFDLVHALEEQGWSVFWDRGFPAGKTWQSYIGKALNDAKCVIVAWSHYSIKSGDVLEEANVAKKRGVIVPVRLDAVYPPFGFNSIQAVDLTDWKLGRSSPYFDQLIQDIAGVIRGKPHPPTPEEELIARPQPTAIPSAIPTESRKEEEPKRQEEEHLLLETEEVEKRELREEVRKRKAQEDEVYFGVSAPRAVKPEGSFIARFAAYVKDAESEVRERLAKADSGQSEFRPQPETCRWKQGTPVTVRVTGDHFTAERPEQSFTWNGRLEIRSFPVRVKQDVSADRIQLGFEIFVAGAAVACLWIDIELTSKTGPAEDVTVTGRPARSAFASYSSEDRADVLGRLSALTTYDKGLEVFYDWLDLVGGENWQQRLEKEIMQRDLLFLFWSRSARGSHWVDWEWRTALRTKGIGAIQPMPIEPPELAEPPEELKQINFRDRYLVAREAAMHITEMKFREGKG